MDQLIDKFQLNFDLFLAQVVNFGILFFVLYKLVYKPILKTLNLRREKIDHSLAQAKAIEERIGKIEEEIAERVKESKMHAVEILKEAKEMGENVRTDILDRTNKEVADMVQRAKEEIYREKESMMHDIQEYIIKTSMLVVDKIVSEKLDSATKDKMIASAFQELPLKK